MTKSLRLSLSGCFRKMKKKVAWRRPQATILGLSLLLLNTPLLAWALQREPIPLSSKAQPLSRRTILGSSVLLIGGAMSSWGALPPTASAARGAAELDFEFYMRDLIGGNKKEGSLPASAMPAIARPRKLKGPILSLLLNDDCNRSCIPVQALIEQLQQQPKRTEKDPDILAGEIQRRVQDLRERSSRSFQTRAPWEAESVSDQYYFDFTAYALWRTAADLLPDYLDRDQFVRRVGQLLYERLVAEKLVVPPPKLTESKSNENILVKSIPTVLQILEVFKESGFCKNYRIRGDDSKEATDPVFDELDDESLAAGGTVDCLVSVFEPATLGADLQITGEQSRFAPDLVGPTLAAAWAPLGIRSAWVTFFVDPEYRPNPKDYFPNEQLLQYTLSKK